MNKSPWSPDSLLYLPVKPATPFLSPPPKWVPPEVDLLSYSLHESITSFSTYFPPTSSFPLWTIFAADTLQAHSGMRCPQEELFSIPLLPYWVWYLVLIILFISFFTLHTIPPNKHHLGFSHQSLFLKTAVKCMFIVTSGPIHCTTNPAQITRKFTLFIQDCGFSITLNLGSSNVKLGKVFVSALPYIRQA